MRFIGSLVHTMVFFNILLWFLVVSGLTLPLPQFYLGLQAGVFDCLAVSILDTRCDPPNTNVADL
jgi:hypothetical protein